MDVLLDERRQGPLGLRPDGPGDPRRDDVEDRDGRAVVGADRVGEGQGQLGMRAAPDRHEDPLDLGCPALLDHGDVAGRRPDDLVDRGRDDRGRLGHRAGAPPRAVRRRLAVGVDRVPATPAEDQQVGLFVRGRLDDPSAAWRAIRTRGWIGIPSGA